MQVGVGLGVKTGIGGFQWLGTLSSWRTLTRRCAECSGRFKRGAESLLFVVCTLVSTPWTALCLPLFERRPALPPGQESQHSGPVLGWSPDPLKIRDVHQKPIGGTPSCTHLPSVMMELLNKADLVLSQERRTEAALIGHNCGHSLKENRGYVGDYNEGTQSGEFREDSLGRSHLLAVPWRINGD